MEVSELIPKESWSSHTGQRVQGGLASRFSSPTQSQSENIPTNGKQLWEKASTSKTHSQSLTKMVTSHIARVNGIPLSPKAGPEATWTLPRWMTNSTASHLATLTCKPFKRRAKPLSSSPETAWVCNSCRCRSSTYHRTTSTSGHRSETPQGLSRSSGRRPRSSEKNSEGTRTF